MVPFSSSYLERDTRKLLLAPRVEMLRSVNAAVVSTSLVPKKAISALCVVSRLFSGVVNGAKRALQI